MHNLTSSPNLRSTPYQPHLTTDLTQHIVCVTSPLLKVISPKPEHTSCSLDKEPKNTDSSPKVQCKYLVNESLLLLLKYKNLGVTQKQGHRNTRVTEKRRTTHNFPNCLLISHSSFGDWQSLHFKYLCFKRHSTLKVVWAWNTVHRLHFVIHSLNVVSLLYFQFSPSTPNTYAKSEV